MNFTPEFWLQVVIAIGSGLGLYTAIRADLATLHERTSNTTKAVDHAHERIDTIQQYVNERRRTP